MFALPALLAGGLSAISLGVRSLSLDELATAAIVTQHGAALRHAIAHDGGNMAGYYALMHVLSGVFGHGPIALRAPSALAAALAAGLVGLLGRRLFDDRVGLSAGLLAAVSLPLVFWGQSARAYAPMLACVTGSYLALVVGLEASGARRRWALGGYAACLALACYMGLLAALVVVAQLPVVARWQRRRTGGVLAAELLAAVACVPLGLLAAARGSGQLAWLGPPSWTAAKQALDELASSALTPNLHAPAAAGAALALTAAGLLASGALAIRRRGTPGLAWRAALLWAWLLVPVALVTLESLAGQPLLVARNLLVSLPAVALLLAWAAWQLPRRALTAGFVAALVAVRALALAPAYGVSPENWRAATRYVLTHARAHDCIAFYPADARMAFAYYLPAGARAPRPVAPAMPSGTGAPLIEDYALPDPAATRGCPRLWLVAGHRGEPDGSAVSRSHYRAYVSLRARMATRLGRPLARRFGYAPPVEVTLFTAAASSPRR